MKENQDINFYDSLFDIITTINAGVALLLAFLILANPTRSNQRANRWFGWFVFLLFYLFFENVLDQLNLFELYPQGELLGLYILTAMPVLLLFTVRYYVEPNRKWKRLDLFHFSYVAFYFLLSLPTFFMDVEEFLQYTDEPPTTLDWVFGLLLFGVFIGQTLTYTYVSYQKLSNHEQQISQFSSIDKMQDLKWLRYFVIVSLLMFIVFVLTELPISDQFEVFLEAAYLVGLLGIAYFSLGQTEVFPYTVLEHKAYQKLITEEQDSKSHPIINKEIAQEKQRLLAYMEAQKPYLDSKLNLSKLAQQLKITPRTLSQVINQGFEENFSSFVNRYRVKEARSILDDPNLHHLTIFQVGLEAGYHSRTVFHTHFKKIVGMSPISYRKNTSTS